MLNIEDKEKEKGRNRILEVIGIINGVPVLKFEEEGEVKVVTFKGNQIVPYKEKTEIKQVEKTNKISRISGSCNESIIEYNIDNKEINFTVSKHPVNLTTILKILLHETKLYKFKYDRVSPFKLRREYNSDLKSHIFTLDFIDIRTYEKQTIELLKTDWSMAIEGEFKMFIPDFLELCVEKNILQRVDNGYKVVKKIHEPMEYCTYLKSKPAIRQLKREGFIIPDKYKELN